MIKNILFILLIVATPIAAWYSFPTHKYSIFGSGVGAIMINNTTGETWVLEKQALVPPTPGLSLNRSTDFCSPTGECYYWVPTAVLPRYAEAIGVGGNPEEAARADENALILWSSKYNKP